MRGIRDILVDRDGMSVEEADDLIDSAKDELADLLEAGDMVAAEDICATWFGLEPDYLMELV